MEIILQKYLPVIQKYYPEVNEDSIAYFDSGHDHHIFLLPNRIAFRFPRGETYGKKDTEITVFLQEFSKKSPVPIQIFKQHRDEEIGVYQIYNFIPGKQFLPHVARQFTLEERKQVAKQLGTFLRILHAYPVAKVEAIGLRAVDVKGYYEYFDDIWSKDREVVYPLLTKAEKEYLDTVFTDYMETKEASFIPVVTHDDMLPEHIIINEEKHTLSGIIDLSLRIADPARDFMFLHVYGSGFLKEALREYGAVDAQFMKRKAFYGVNFYVMYLYDAITRKKTKEAVSKYKNALSSYLNGRYIPS